MTGARRTLRRAAPLVLVGLAWATVTWLAPDEGPGPRLAVPVFTDWQFNPFGKGDPLPAVQHNADTVRAAEAGHATVRQLLEQGSLRGTEADGDWGRWVDDRLVPSHSLRRRFDWLLTLLGETGPAQMRHWIEQEVSAERNAAAARQVLEVWDKYLTLQQRSFRQQANPADPSNWQAALAERVQARQQLLGRDWAQAFYADEEQAFEAHLREHHRERSAGATSADADPAALLVARAGTDAQALHQQRVQQLGVEAADRLRAEDAAWADWERRLTAARARMQAIADAPELSVVQQRQAQEAYVAENFSGNELVRVRALLGLS